MLTQTIRRQFLEYFKKQKHSIIPSSPVVPHDDPTLLFNNAGMNQFKDVFLGKSTRDYNRAATSQKCVRVGGKHNDLENVGHTSRHLTFFEMLGNFSFGDYFKEQAIQFAWDVSTNIFQFDPQYIYPTVFETDDEAFELWTRYVPAARITRMGEKDNFWTMGDTGPCGPCSELYYDRGSKYGEGRNPAEDTEGNRFIEFWNLVFMQYNKQANGVVNPLPQPSIDTGAGLERIISLKLHVDSVFETDVLRSLIAQVEDLSGIPYNLHDSKAPAFRVIADHLRCLSFAIADGAQPSNVDRGYVLRKLLRRAVRYGRQLGMDEPFLARVLPQLIDTMGGDYPELVKSKDRIAEILTSEEEAFIRTLRRGGNILNQVIDKAEASSKVISGDDAFKLKDTYGLPLEEILLIAKDSHLTVDQKRYQSLEEEAKVRSRSAKKDVQQIASENIFADFLAKNGETQFIGYSQSSSVAKVLGLFSKGEFVKELPEGSEGIILLDKTPFYAEMGGQVGDTGTIIGQGLHVVVTDSTAPYKGLIGHKGKVDKGIIKIGDSVAAAIDIGRRLKIANNHTATHLLHWALHKVLGEHIQQAGSVVDAERLRFDFSHHKALSSQEIRQIEDLVNARIRENLPVRSYELPYEDVQKRQDIKQFFGDKYGSTVRVIDIDFSKELCGGTHTSAAGNIGLFRILKESSIAAGVRRIEAVTGKDAELFGYQFEEQLLELANLLKAQPAQLKERLEKLLSDNKSLSQELKVIRKGQLSGQLDALMKTKELINSTQVVMAELPVSIEDLRTAADDAMEKLGNGIVILAATTPDKCQVVVKVSDDMVKQGFSANDIVKAIAPIIEGSGGGKQNLAQVGGKNASKLKDAFAIARKHIETIRT